jgi:hypothetical protein
MVFQTRPYNLSKERLIGTCTVVGVWAYITSERVIGFRTEITTLIRQSRFQIVQRDLCKHSGAPCNCILSFHMAYDETSNIVLKCYNVV